MDILALFEYYFCNDPIVFSNVKPIVNIDVDGIILDFAKGFANWLNIEKGYNVKYNHTVPNARF